MNFSGVKLIATDMDGTLLNSQHEMDPRVLSLFETFKKKGVLFAAASGRQLYNLENRFPTIKEDMLFLAENGSFVRYKGEELLLQALEPEWVKHFILLAREVPDSHIIFCGKSKAWTESNDPRFLAEVHQYFDRHEVVDDLLQVQDDCLKVTLCNLDKGAALGSFPYFEKYTEEFQVKVSGKIWLDISHKLANKGRALETVQKHFGITPEETMVFGDYLNDVEMMKQASFSFAMANAMPEVKEAANYETLSNDEGGVVHILERVAADL
ncbi:MAG: Cof-type HAD-IIB family hydrolase [Bacteroidales bacterium]